MKMPIYYIILFEELIPCYLIKEGYIPCKHYRENKNDDYYACYSREQFCISSLNDKEGIFEDKNKAIEALKIKIETNFNDNIKRLIKNRDNKLKKLNHK